MEEFIKQILQLLFVAITFGNYGLSQNEKTSLVGSTDYYEFYDDYWINLHHFLYQKAKGSQKQKLEQDGNQFSNIGETEAYKGLNTEQLNKLDTAIEYYKAHIVQKSLLRGLSKELVWLQKQEINQRILDIPFSKKYTEILNQASEVYKTSFWPIHSKQNKLVLYEYLSIIRRIENPVFSKMEKLSMDSISSKKKIRVDLTAYANYAGAYTVTKPYFNIFLSSLDPNFKTTAFIETVFHEGSHLLFTYDSPFRGGIAKIFKKKGLEMGYPGHLWHASLFYLCGRVIQDELKEHDSIDHVLLMNQRNIFKSYNTVVFRESLENYYKNKSDYESTIHRMLNHLNHKKVAD
ncbi:hypothetical protein [uncultured Croceitalea sp.]|uniref:hypothetical protein n=1 Tax=uncultured Croceitalea sp. TaxID=1798908 RepID=UPI0033062BE7